ncbi:MAG: response regulator [Crocinitomicaceae bacterium]|nr:response regulator [Flavobacteriales bacterium]NQZ38267.1 response regulator [Crocinitomicaceae bacterium]PHR22007.1 MAG: DNA-binding response regulator [Fluviicola sp.]
MNKVTIAVVEDEVIIANDICDTLETLGYSVLEPAINYTEALETIEKHKPDLVILDIQLSGKKDGIDLAWKIKEDYNIPFIFLTSNADQLTIDRAKRVDPPAYLMKPFNEDELYSSIEIVLFNFAEKQKEDENLVINDSIFIKQQMLFKKVKFEDILFLKSDHVYVEIVTKNQNKYVVRGTLNSYLGKLDNNFVRIHRSYIANLSHLDMINQVTIKIGAIELPIGQRYRKTLLDRINIA